MRVPTAEQQSVLPSNPFGSTAPQLQRPDFRPAQDIANLGKQVGGFTQAVGGAVSRELAQGDADAINERNRVLKQNDADLKAAEDARKRAKAALQAEALVELQRKADDETAGLFGREGFDAMRESGPTKDRLDKHLKDIGERFVDPMDRLEFDNLGNAALLSRRKSIEEYTTKQNLAGTKATLEGLRSEAVRGAASVDLTPQEMKASVGAVDATYDRILPPEAAAAAKTELRADMSEAMIQRRIQSGDIEGAKAILAGDESILGPKRSKALKGAVESAEKDFTAKGVAAEVNGLADQVRDEHRIVTGKALRDAMPKLAEDDPRRQAFETALEKQSVLEDKRLKELLEVERNNAENAFGDNVALPDQTRKVLEKYDRRYLTALEDAEETRRERRRARREGTPAQRHAVDKQQAEDDEAFRYRLEKRLTEDPTVSPRDVLSEFVEEKAKAGRRVTISEPERERAGATSAKYQKDAGSKESTTQRAWASKLEAEIGPMAKPTKKGSREDPEITQTWVGEGLVQYRAALERNGGKPLDSKQEAELKASIIHQARSGKPTVTKAAPKPLGPEYVPQASKKVRFPNGQTFDVSPDKMDAAMRKGGVVLE